MNKFINVHALIMQYTGFDHKISLNPRTIFDHKTHNTFKLVANNSVVINIFLLITQLSQQPMFFKLQIAVQLPHKTFMSFPE